MEKWNLGLIDCPENRQEKNNNSEYWWPVEEHRVGLQTPASRITRDKLKKKKKKKVEKWNLGLINCPENRQKINNNSE